MTQTKRTCEHCGREMSPAPHARHVKVCLDNPEIYERVATVIRSNSDATRIRPYRQYGELTTVFDLPSASALRFACGGSWTGVAERFGLHATGKTEDDNLHWQHGMAIFVEHMQKKRAQIESSHADMPACRAYRILFNWNARTHSWTPAYERTAFEVNVSVGRPVLAVNEWLAEQLADGIRPTGARRTELMKMYLWRYALENSRRPADPKGTWCYAVRRALRLAKEQNGQT